MTVMKSPCTGIEEIEHLNAICNSYYLLKLKGFVTPRFAIRINRCFLFRNFHNSLREIFHHLTELDAVIEEWETYLGLDDEWHSRLNAELTVQGFIETIFKFKTQGLEYSGFLENLSIKQQIGNLILLEDWDVLM